MELWKIIVSAEGRKKTEQLVKFGRRVLALLETDAEEATELERECEGDEATETENDVGTM